MSLHSLSSSDFDPSGFEFGAIEPLQCCPHLASSLPSALPSLDWINFSSTTCSIPECTNSLELWLCLTCFSPFCGRFALSHSSAHSKPDFSASDPAACSALSESAHPLVLSLADLGCWCYRCDGYIHQNADPMLKDIYRELHLKKHGEYPPEQRTSGLSLSTGACIILAMDENEAKHNESDTQTSADADADDMKS